MLDGPSSAGPTMSPRTAPASIEVSCPGSPTRMSRACGRTASSNRAIWESETIEVSSTITTSWGSRLPRWWRKRLWLSGRQPSRRCRVEALAARSWARTASLASSSSAASWTASSRRAAATAVGAASAMRGWGRPAASACSASSATMRATVVVLPVPGPPATTAKRWRTAAAPAARWRSSGSPGKSRARPSASTALVDVCGRLGAERLEVGGDLALLAPVAVEVERGADEAQRPVRSTLFAYRDEVAGLQSFGPRRDRRPGQRRQVDGLLGVDRRGLADGGEVDVDVAEARPAHGERRRQRDLLVVVRRRAPPAGARRGRRRRRARRRR